MSDSARSADGTEQKPWKSDTCEVDGCDNETTDYRTYRIRAVCCEGCIEYHDEHGHWPDSDETDENTERVVGDGCCQECNEAGMLKDQRPAYDPDREVSVSQESYSCLTDWCEVVTFALRRRKSDGLVLSRSVRSRSPNGQSNNGSIQDCGYPESQRSQDLSESDA